MHQVLVVDADGVGLWIGTREEKGPLQPYFILLPAPCEICLQARALERRPLLNDEGVIDPQFDPIVWVVLVLRVIEMHHERVRARNGGRHEARPAHAVFQGRQAVHLLPPAHRLRAHNPSPVFLYQLRATCPIVGEAEVDGFVARSSVGAWRAPQRSLHLSITRRQGVVRSAEPPGVLHTGLARRRHMNRAPILV